MSLLLPPTDLEALQSTALQDDLRRGHHVKTVLAVHNQARLASVFSALGPHHHPVFGQLTMVVDPVIVEEFQRTEGPQCWSDPNFRKDFARANPECRIRSKAARTTIVRP